MFMVYAAKEHDLSQYNVQTEDGTSGWIFDNYVQEIDIETGGSPSVPSFRNMPLIWQARPFLPGAHSTTSILRKDTPTPEILVSAERQLGISS
jgi:hypothetical protein